MNSPVYALLQQLVTIDKSLQQPVYIQVAQQLINAIQRGYVAKGTKLPGTRLLSKLLQINRNTAVAIYDELASQGWVNITPNSGTFVLKTKEEHIKIKGATQQIQQSHSHPKFTGFPFHQSFNLAPNPDASELNYTISEGKPDLRLHSVHQFSRWYSAAMKRKTILKKWNRPKNTASSIFNTQLCNYLNTTRGFHLQPQHVAHTRSTEMGLYTVSRLLINPKDLVLVGRLSNYAANMIFQQAGALIKTIPLDAEGLDINYIQEHFTKGSIRCVYVCANRDYPTTVPLSAKRRLQLLALAKAYGFAIIEDDHDHDFQFDGSAMLPMASADPHGHVIYLGKLGQSLFPSFQTSFIVAAESLITEAQNYVQLLDKQGDLIQEQILAELIAEGEIHRLKKKNMISYKQRRDHLCHCLSEQFKGILQWQKPTGGLAIWLQFERHISLLQLAAAAQQLDLFIPKTILYQDKTTCAIRFGYGHLELAEISIVVNKLKQAYDALG